MPERTMEQTAADVKRPARNPEPAPHTYVRAPAPAWNAAGACVPGAPSAVLAVQRAAGNQAVMRMLDANRPNHPLAGPAPTVQRLSEDELDDDNVQRATAALHEPSDEAIRSAAAEGVRTPSTTLPHLDRIQASFGRHSIAHIQAHVGPEAARASRAMNALAYASGNHVVFGATPDLRTAAHEAAHIVQQQAGVQLSGGIGREGDAYERQADAVADAVVTGRWAEAVLGNLVPHCAPTSEPQISEQGSKVVQRKIFLNNVELSAHKLEKLTELNPDLSDGLRYWASSNREHCYNDTSDATAVDLLINALQRGSRRGRSAKKEEDRSSEREKKYEGESKREADKAASKQVHRGYRKNRGRDTSLGELHGPPPLESKVGHKSKIKGPASISSRRRTETHPNLFGNFEEITEAPRLSSHMGSNELGAKTGMSSQFSQHIKYITKEDTYDEYLGQIKGYDWLKHHREMLNRGNLRHKRPQKKKGGKSTSKFSQNRVRASLTLVLQKDKESRAVTLEIPGTFMSGEGLRIEAVKEWLISEKLIKSPQEYDPARHAHSEQELVVYLLDKQEEFLGELAKRTDRNEVAAAIVLDLVSYPNTVCGFCHGSLDRLMGKVLLPSARKLLKTEEVTGIINASGKEKFGGSGPKTRDQAKWLESVVAYTDIDKDEKNELDNLGRESRAKRRGRSSNQTPELKEEPQPHSGSLERDEEKDLVTGIRYPDRSFSVENVDNDGNCFYECCKRFLNYPRDAGQLRRDFSNNEKLPEKYRISVGKDKQYAPDEDMSAIANLLNVTLVLHVGSYGSTTVQPREINEGSGGTMDLLFLHDPEGNGHTQLMRLKIK